MGLDNRKRFYTARTYCYSGHPYGYATFTDLHEGQGLLQIHSDWGVFHSYWNAIGKDRTIEEFVLSCDSSYIASNFEYWMRFGHVKKEGFTLLNKFMINCWPHLRKVIEEEYTKNKVAGAILENLEGKTVGEVDLAVMKQNLTAVLQSLLKDQGVTT